ncbi:hypothetical protein TSAR_016312 [Trichomalopsis sarcophagae]|uniref:Chitin-binding type-2 domain-containing protein n=1 Tax=Trichomalopsis sarcophagae TaxID=543379 RepID=A0A232FB72_9HYME|nr:hypothetical protein TSAR_016312 [Trichomalopsis sarcophagae]
MKVITSLVIFGLAAIAYAAVVPELSVPADVKVDFEPQCPVVNGPNVTLIANPDNCTTYFSCDMGKAWEMACPIGLHFNDKEKVCDWPERACCDPAYDPEKKCEEKSEENSQ